MTTPLHSNEPYLMRDFAALDPRSAHAHLRGRSWRARSYKLFETMSRLLGRSQQAADDYRHLSRWLYRHREPLAWCATLTCNVATALAGLAAGVGLYLVFQP